jgi:NitT/TauT family transport system permease protein
MKRAILNLRWPLAVFVVVILTWHAACIVFKIPAYILPPPSAVAAAVAERHQNLIHAFQITAVEAAGGFLLSILGGISIALLFAQSPIIRRSLYPYTLVLQTVPIVAIAPLILMWFGSGVRSVMGVAFIICLFPIIANTTQGLVSVPRNLMDLFSRSRRLSGRAQFLDIRQPDMIYQCCRMFPFFRVGEWLGEYVTGHIIGVSIGYREPFMLKLFPHP